MKKFLVLCMLAVAILIPTEIVEAADVPEFLSVVGNKAKYIGGQQIRERPGKVKHGNYDTFAYQCDVDSGKDIAVEYCKYLISEYPFRFVDAFEDDYIKTSATRYTVMFFNYTGSKYVSKITSTCMHEKRDYHGHVVIWVTENFLEGTAKITVSVPIELTYG